MDGSQGDVAPELRAREVYALHGLVHTRARLGAGRAEGGHVEHAATRAEESAVTDGRASVEDESAERFRVLGPPDLDADLVLFRIAPGGEDDRDRPLGRDGRPDAAEAARRGPREQLEEIALEPGGERLRLRIAEAAVELEDARVALRQHQARVEEADERGAAPGQLGEDRPVNGLDDLLDPSGPAARARARGTPAPRVSDSRVPRPRRRGGRGPRPQPGPAPPAQRVAAPRGERGLRPDHGQVDPLGPAELDE